MSLKDKCLDLRLAAARLAQERSRFALLAATIASLALLTAGWNAYFGYYRQFALEQKQATPTDENRNYIADKLRTELFNEWVRSQMISISLLGLRVGVDDATMVGAVAMWIILYWESLCMRREHYSIAHLFRDYRHGTQAERVLVFYGVNAYTVLTNVQHSDLPYWKLDEPVRPLDSARVRWSTRVMHCLPLISLALLIALDIQSLFFGKSPFRDDWDHSLYNILRGNSDRGTYDITMILVWHVVALILLIPAGILCHRIVHFAEATEGLLHEFLQGLIADYGHDLGVRQSERNQPEGVAPSE